MEKKYGTLFVKRACFRYYQMRGNEQKLKREIAQRENELDTLKSKQRT